MGRHTECSYSSPLPAEWLKGKLVGSGSYGSVHLAMSKSTGGLFVVKSAQSQEGVHALENEAKILNSLNSPYVVRCMGTENENVFMEYMAGGSLSDVAQLFGGAFDEEVVRLYTKEILHGLKYLHGNGIVHCDIKCKNVLLSSSGNVKLADFGCAKRLNEPNFQSIKNVGVGGTPLWMAPEVLRNEFQGRVDVSCDIWSLGCTVIEMATGRPPWSFNSKPLSAAVMNIAYSNERPPFPKQFSAEGLDFLTKCLERDPKKRWYAEQLLNHPFIFSAGNLSSRKKETCSPASTLDDIGIYDDQGSDCSSTTDHDCHDSEFNIRRNPFSRCVAAVTETSSPFESSENWITVR